jgi:hypothetical protein
MARWIFVRCFTHTRRESSARLRVESGQVRRWRSEGRAGVKRVTTVLQPCDMLYARNCTV